MRAAHREGILQRRRNPDSATLQKSVRKSRFNREFCDKTTMPTNLVRSYWMGRRLFDLCDAPQHERRGREHSGRDDCVGCEVRAKPVEPSARQSAYGGACLVDGVERGVQAASLRGGNEKHGATKYQG